MPYTWLATGSFGRLEAFPSSDVDCAMAWDGPDEDPRCGRADRGARRAACSSGLAQCGFAPDEKGAVASNPLFARSVTSWEAAARAWVEDPDRDRGLMLLSVVVESDPVWGETAVADRLAAAFARIPDRELMLHRLAAAALPARPPTGFLRDLVLQSSGERRACSTSSAAGCFRSSRWRAGRAGRGRDARPRHAARLKASHEDAGTLPDEDVAILSDAFELVCELRMEHQVDQLRAGEDPDDLIEPKRPAPLTRAALKDAFRGVRRVQRRLDAERTLARYWSSGRHPLA